MLQLRRAKPSAGKRVYCTGIIPSLMYDAPVFVAFGQHLRRIKNDAALFYGDRGGGRGVDVPLCA